MPADEALRIGLVDRVVPDASVYEQARTWMAQFVHGPAVALRAAKQAIDDGLNTDLATGLGIERTHFAALFAPGTRARGMHALLAKETPTFKGS